MSEFDAAVQARITTLTRIDRAETDAEREAMLIWADAEAIDHGLSSISRQYARWIENGRSF
jgi:hypothetical protein